MSNHTGSYLLNEVLIKLEEENVFKMLGEEKTLTLIREIIQCSRRYDCNADEILYNIGKKLKICCSCLEKATLFNKYGICEDCK